MGNWNALQALFDEAIELEGEARDAFVQGVRKDDSLLGEELEALLAADGDDTLTPRPIGFSGDGDPVREAGGDQLVGETLGAYRLLGRVGSGGMGTVYLGERADGAFERQVAVKVVRRGMDTDQVLQRFQAEREILSRLDHPNISALLDGGATPDGRPYLVMEYVDGQTITEYCDSNRLTINQRVGLFRDVCRAVHHAHQNLVVHRDLKPSNILVTADGTVKLLDFGIAKLLDESEQGGLTRTGLQAMTPAYASPEQLTSQPITTVTDVYALGVILYELLAGRRPFEARRSAEEMRELVLSGNAPKPSTAITKVPDPAVDGAKSLTLETISESRALSPNRLSQALSGDLDTICLAAIRLEPEERYSSAQQLADDLRRHLAGEPVMAQTPSVAYRFGKFVSRNRVGVMTAALVTVGFFALVFYYTQELAKERDTALAEQAKTAAVVEFLTDLFTEADPNQSLGEDVTARQILEAGSDRIASELLDAPELRASIQTILGQVYYRLGNNDAADALYAEAYEVQRTAGGLEAAETRLSMGLIEQDIGEWEAAEASIQYAIDERMVALGPVNEEVREAISALAFLKETQAEFDAAEALHLQAYEMAETLYPEDDITRAQTRSELAGFYRVVDRNPEAEELLRDGLAMMGRLYGDAMHPLTAKMSRQLAGLLRNTNRYEESEALYIKAIEMQESLFGQDHHEVAVSYNGYSQLMIRMERDEEALELNGVMIEIMERIYDGPVPNLAVSYHNRATMLADAGRTDEALATFRAALQMMDDLELPPRHLNRSFPTNSIARIYADQERYDLAEPMFRDMLELRLEILGEEHRLIAEQHFDLGKLLLNKGEVAEAETWLLKSFTYFEKTQGPEDRYTIFAAEALARLYTELGQPGQAERFEAIANPPEAMETAES